MIFYRTLWRPVRIYMVSDLRWATLGWYRLSCIMPIHLRFSCFTFSFNISLICMVKQACIQRVIAAHRTIEITRALQLVWNKIYMSKKCQFEDVTIIQCTITKHALGYPCSVSLIFMASLLQELSVLQRHFSVSVLVYCQLYIRKLWYLSEFGVVPL